MKNISPALQTHLNGELTTLAYLVKITRKDGVIKGFTTHDQNLAVEGITYVADGALTPSAMESRAGLAVDNLEVTGVLDSAEIAAADIEAGLYDHARIDVYACNWANVAQGLARLRRGWLGQVTQGDNYYVAEVRGLHDLLQRPIGETYTPECRFDLGDSRCGVDLGARASSGSVTHVIDRATFCDSSQPAASDVFAYGILMWTSGANAGRSMDVKAWDKDTQQLTLWLPMPNPLAQGDTYTVTPGCDKRFATCKSVFANGAHFGGFPFVPGIGNILKYPT